MLLGLCTATQDKGLIKTHNGQKNRKEKMDKNSISLCRKRFNTGSDCDIRVQCIE